MVRMKLKSYFTSQIYFLKTSNDGKMNEENYNLKIIYTYFYCEDTHCIR